MHEIWHLNRSTVSCFPRSKTFVVIYNVAICVCFEPQISFISSKKKTIWAWLCLTRWEKMYLLQAKIFVEPTKNFVDLSKVALKSTIFNLTKKKHRNLHFLLVWRLCEMKIFSMLLSSSVIFFLFSCREREKDESFFFRSLILANSIYEKRSSSDDNDDNDDNETALNIKYSCDGISVACLECAFIRIVQVTLPQCNSNYEGFFVSYNYRSYHSVLNRSQTQVFIYTHKQNDTIQENEQAMQKKRINEWRRKKKHIVVLNSRITESLSQPIFRLILKWN